MRENKYNLTEGNILSKLMMISLPAIGTQIITMTYNLADMFWLGRLSSDSVAASGTAGMYLWLMVAFMLFGSRGAEIGVSQNIGKGDSKEARSIAETAFFLAVFFGVTCGATLIFLAKPLIGFFGITEVSVSDMAENYLKIVGFGLPFNFAAASLAGIYGGSGNSRMPFFANIISVFTNLILDPVFIFKFDLGIEGAAIATTIAQVINCAILCFSIKLGRSRPFANFSLLSRPVWKNIRHIIIQVLPLSIESFLFCFMSMVITRLVATYGADAIAAQRVSGQIESVSWLVAGGFSSSFTAYIGQNFGARKWDRIKEGFRLSSLAMLVYGIIITAAMFLGGKYFLALFLPDNQNAVSIGENFLKFLASCQTFACLEGIAAGAFRGFGETLKPSAASIISNFLRTVLAYFLSKTSLGLNGVWFAIVAGSALRGIWIYTWYLIDSKKIENAKA